MRRFGAGVRRIAFAFTVMVWVVTPSGESVTAPAGQPPLVDVDPVVLEVSLQSVPVIGRVVSLQAGVVAAETQGVVVHVAVEVGDRVTKGQLLARLDTRTLTWRQHGAMATVAERRAQGAKAEATLRRTETELKRLEKLRPSAAFPLAKYEDKAGEVAQMRAATEAARAALEQGTVEVHLAEIERAKAEIRAPYPGVVRKRPVVVGFYIATGADVVDLVNDQALEVEAEVTVERGIVLTPGTGVTVKTTSGLTLPATVRAVVPDEDPKTRTRLVRFAFTGPADSGPLMLAANESVTVFLETGGREKRPTVSKDAVIYRDNQAVVFVVEERVARMRSVRLGQSVKGRFVVESGLEAGEKVVVRGNERLQSGQTVRLPTDDAATGLGASERRS